MSLLTSSFPFLLNNKARPFSDVSAFKKPTVSKNFQEVSNGNTTLVASIYPTDLSKNQVKAAQTVEEDDDCELIMYEPVKKIKSGSISACHTINNKTHHNKAKQSKLTVQDVFDAPLESEQKKRQTAAEEMEDGSSLSFISSCSSLDNLDEEPIAHRHRKNSECMILDPIIQVPQIDTQSLVMKDDVVRHLNYLRPENTLFNTTGNHLPLFSYSQQPMFQYSEFLKTLPGDFGNTEELICNVPLSIPPNKLTEYFQSTLYTKQALQQDLTISDKTLNEFAKNHLGPRSQEDGYDSDSYATRSTSANADGEKSQKGASPLYGPNYDLCEDEKVSIKVNQKKPKEEKVQKPANKTAAKTNPKEKKLRSLNLQLDLNQKQFKVERRLNRLQLLRYQGTIIGEGDEELKKLGMVELMNDTTSPRVQEAIPCQVETSEAKAIDSEIQNSFNQFISEQSQAIIPAFGEESIRKERTVLAAKWNPEVIQGSEFEAYLQSLEQTLEIRITNQEVAVKLLKTFGMNITLALEAIRQNKATYSEIFRLKIKRLRRRGA